MISVVIPIHNQEHNIKRIIDGYKDQSLKPDNIIFVLDRCTDNSEKVIKKEIKPIKYHILKTDESVGFSAGITRNVGILKALSLGSDYIVMTDGDCIPSKGLVEGHISTMSMFSSNVPTLTCGYRFDYTYTGSVVADSRIMNKDAKQYMYDMASPVLIMNEYPLLKSWICWSCNIAINRRAAEAAISVNSTLSGDKDRVFSSIFDGRWGGEDGFLGLTIFRIGGNVIMCPPSNKVTHIWHERGHTNLEHLCYVSNADMCLKNAIYIGDIKGPITEVSSLSYPKDYYDISNIRMISVEGYKHEGCADNLSAFYYARNIKHTHKHSNQVNDLNICVEDVEAYIKHKAIIDNGYVYTKNEKIDARKAGSEWL